MKKKIRIIHLTSVHPRYDTRIFFKMCLSLVNVEYDVTLIVADNKGDEIKDKVSIVDVGMNGRSRLLRVTKTVKLIFEKAKELNGDIYHLHDPELIPIGLKLKKLGKKIIFDMHEDVTKQILSKNYLNSITRTILSKLYEYYERRNLSKFDMVITATPYIRNKLLQLNSNIVDVNNYPLAEEFKNSSNFNKKNNEIVYVGGLSEIRGIEELILSLSFMKKVKLNLVGKFSNNQFENKLKNHNNWAQVNFHGFLDRHGVKKVLDKSRIGIVTLHPKINYLDSQPVKMFEYMSAGLPIVASNFPFWKDIIEGNNCGICVNPLNPKAISEAVNYLFNNPSEAERMGKNGIKIIKKIYNWFNEEKKLLFVYEKLLR